MELAITAILLSLHLRALQGSPPALPFNFTPTNAIAINLDSGRTNTRVGERGTAGERAWVWGADKERCVIPALPLVAFYLGKSCKEPRRWGPASTPPDSAPSQLLPKPHCQLHFVLHLLQCIQTLPRSPSPAAPRFLLPSKLG